MESCWERRIISWAGFLENRDGSFVMGPVLLGLILRGVRVLVLPCLILPRGPVLLNYGIRTPTASPFGQKRTTEKITFSQTSGPFRLHNFSVPRKHKYIKLYIQWLHIRSISLLHCLLIFLPFTIVQGTAQSDVFLYLTSWDYDPLFCITNISSHSRYCKNVSFFAKVDLPYKDKRPLMEKELYSIKPLIN